MTAPLSPDFAHLAAHFRRKADTERDQGHEDAAMVWEEAADMVGATCPHCGGDLIGERIDRIPDTPAEDIAFLRYAGGVVPREVVNRYGRDFAEQLNRPSTDSEEN